MAMKLLGRTGHVAGRNVSVPHLLRIGAAEDNEFRVVVRGISRYHARILRDGSQYWLEDSGSTNGTFLNGQRVTRERIAHLDVITLGRDIDLIVVATDAGTSAPIRLVTEAAFEWMDGPERGARVDVPPGQLTIGRVAPSNIIVDSPVVSQLHARLQRTPENVLLVDLESVNGTFVNGRRISKATVVRNGDQVSIAGIRQFKLHLTGDSGKQQPQNAVFASSVTFDQEWQTRLVWSADELAELESQRRKAEDMARHIQEQQQAAAAAKPGAAKPAAAARPAAPAAAKPAAPAPAAAPKPAATPAKPAAAPAAKPAAAAPPAAPARAAAPPPKSDEAPAAAAAPEAPAAEKPAAPKPPPAAAAPKPAAPPKVEAAPKPGETPAAAAPPKPAAAPPPPKPPAPAPPPVAASAPPAPSAEAAGAAPAEATPKPAAPPKPAPPPKPAQPAAPAAAATPAASAAPTPAAAPPAAPKPAAPVPKAAAPATPPAQPAAAAPPTPAAPPRPAPPKPARAEDDEPMTVKLPPGMFDTETTHFVDASPPPVKSVRLRLAAGSTGIPAPVTLAVGRHIIGRATDASMTVHHPQVSRHHAIAVVNEFGMTLEDWKSANGTFVNNEPVQGAPAIVSDGDTIAFGSVQFTVEFLR